MGFTRISHLLDWCRSNNLSLNLIAILVNSIFLSLGSFLLCGLVDLKRLRCCEVLALKVLKEDVVCHLLAELVVAQTAILDEWADVIPVLVIVLFISLAKTCKLLSNLL